MQSLEEHSAEGTIEQLLAFESRHGLWQQRLLGYPIWPALRLGYGLQLANRHLRSSDTQKDERSAKRYRRIGLSATDVKNKLSEARQRDIWVLSSTVYRRSTPTGSTCIFAQHLREQLGHRLLFLELNPNAGPCSPSDDTLFIDSIAVSAREIAGKTAPLFRAWLRGPLATLDQWGLDSARALKEAIAGQLQHALWKKVLHRARPQAVFVLCSYSQHVPVQLAARELGIPLIELQHGIIDREHAGYAFGKQTDLPHAPNHIVVFGERFGHILDVNAHWAGNWSIGGQPWLRRIREQHASSVPTQPLVTIFSQNTSLVQERLRKFTIALRQSLPASIEIVIKPHPGEVDAERVYGDLVSLGVTLIDRMADSYELLAKTRISICEFSTLALEALAFPCHSLILSAPTIPKELRELASVGALGMVNSAQDVAPYLSKPPGAQRNSVVNSYFALDAEEPRFEDLIARCVATNHSGNSDQG